MWEYVAPVRRGLSLAAAAGLITAALAGCGGQGSSSSSSAAGTGATTGSGATGTAHSSTTAAPGHARRHRRADRPAPKVHGPAVGATQSLQAYGASLHVTVTGVRSVSPRDASPPPGNRAVAVVLRIADESGATYDSTASGDLSVIVSTGETAPLDIRGGPCETQLVDFESHLYSGVVRTGCVGFSVPRHARVLGVRFSPHAQSRGSVSWRVGR
jgi:hypothetical protein